MEVQNPKIKDQNKSQLQRSKLKTNSRSKVPKFKSFWILSLGFWILSFGFTLPSYALDDPEAKIAKVIENYVIAKYPNWAGLEILVTFRYADKIFEELRGLEGEVDFKIVEVYKDFKPVGDVIFPIEVSSGEFSKKIFVRTQVEVLKKIVVAKKNIKRGEKIEAKDLTLAERDIAMLPNKYFEDLDQVANSLAKTTIPKKSIIFEWMIKEIPLVHRGDEVTILVTAPNLLVKTKGVALEDGYRDKKVKVKRKNSKKTLEGILISENEVEVKLK